MRSIPVLVVLAFAASAPAASQQKVQLPALDRAVSLTIQPLYSVGAADGAAWETFEQVWQVAFDRQGRLYVLDTGNQRIHIFDPAGKFVRSIGRRGNGPGELTAPIGLAITASDELIHLRRRAQFRICRLLASRGSCTRQPRRKQPSSVPSWDPIARLSLTFRWRSLQN